MSRLHVVDGTFELYRAEYSKRPPRAAPSGQDIKASAGVAESLLQLLRDEDEQVTHLAVAFDNPIRSFRNDLFAGYKSDDGVPPHLSAQFDLVEELTAALGIRVWSMAEFEADDALASAARRFGAEVDEVRILTPDKDLGQVLAGGRVVQVDRIRRRVIDEGTFRAERGIAPASLPDYLALVGDTADGIPGLAGFGEKSAASLLAAFPHLEDIPDDPSSWPKLRGRERLAATLAAGRSEAELFRRLATLMSDVPLGASLEDLRWRGPTAELGSLAGRLGLAGLLDRIPSARRGPG